MLLLRVFHGPRQGVQSPAGDDVDGALDAERQRAHRGADDDRDDPLGNLGGVSARLPEPVLCEGGGRVGAGRGGVGQQKKDDGS